MVLWKHRLLSYVTKERESTILSIIMATMEILIFTNFKIYYRMRLLRINDINLSECAGIRPGPLRKRIQVPMLHDDDIKWKHFPRYWPFVRWIHRSPVNSPHIGQWRGALMLSFICAWRNGWVNDREAGDIGRHRAHYDVTVMSVI